MAPRPEHPRHLAEHLQWLLHVLEHPDAHNEVERLAGEWEVLTDAAENRHPRRPMLA